VEQRFTRPISLAHCENKPLSLAATCMRDLVRGLLIEAVRDDRWKGSLIERTLEEERNTSDQ